MKSSFPLHRVARNDEIGAVLKLCGGIGGSHLDDLANSVGKAQGNRKDKSLAPGELNALSKGETVWLRAPVERGERLGGIFILARARVRVVYTHDVELVPRQLDLHHNEGTEADVRGLMHN